MFLFQTADTGFFSSGHFDSLELFLLGAFLIAAAAGIRRVLKLEK